jgi:hypothetical protein
MIAYQSNDQFGELQNNTIADSQALLLANGLPAKTGITAITAVAVVDATDLPTAIALTNANKAKINAILAAMKVVS